MIIDVVCTNAECRLRRDDLLIKSDAPLPPCEACGQPTDRVWELRRLGVEANASSVRFHFNYPEDSR